jgi:hypothetical protein
LGFSFLSILRGHRESFNPSDGFDWDRLIIYLRRVELVTLVATSGALGADPHEDQVKKLLDGEPVNFPDDREKSLDHISDRAAHSEFWSTATAPPSLRRSQ